MAKLPKIKWTDRRQFCGDDMLYHAASDGFLRWGAIFKRASGFAVHVDGVSTVYHTEAWALRKLKQYLQGGW